MYKAKATTKMIASARGTEPVEDSPFLLLPEFRRCDGEMDRGWQCKRYGLQLKVRFLYTGELLGL